MPGNSSHTAHERYSFHLPPAQTLSLRAVNNATREVLLVPVVHSKEPYRCMFTAVADRQAHPSHRPPYTSPEPLRGIGSAAGGWGGSLYTPHGRGSGESLQSIQQTRGHLE